MIYVIGKKQANRYKIFGLPYNREVLNFVAENFLHEDVFIEYKGYDMLLERSVENIKRGLNICLPVSLTYEGVCRARKNTRIAKEKYDLHCASQIERRRL